MGCVYTITNKNGTDVDYSLNELTRFYYESTQKLDNTKIYSSEKIQDSTLQEITSRLIDKDGVTTDYMAR